MPEDKYIATIESKSHKSEVVCSLGKEGFQQIGTLGEVTAFKEQWLKMFPESPITIYRLEEVKDE